MIEKNILTIYVFLILVGILPIDFAVFGMVLLYQVLLSLAQPTLEWLQNRKNNKSDDNAK